MSFWATVSLTVGMAARKMGLRPSSAALSGMKRLMAAAVPSSAQARLPSGGLTCDT
eukprot:CAMPEP_0175420950 /NCGR_PEP_ID=MMETSP0095-20121207/47000_1 /TAXON_ID=311494 /ORGANISM="Alexandrium monilatum, Strain CCMP3105" /LENGTH=55 /DNA_ID=CAMNT_0016720171 /DNA_START=280 /DNA_END=444 /DNA_ORIENTATION=-